MHSLTAPLLHTSNPPSLEKFEKLKLTGLKPTNQTEAVWVLPSASGQYLSLPYFTDARSYTTFNRFYRGVFL